MLAFIDENAPFNSVRFRSARVVIRFCMVAVESGYRLLRRINDVWRDSELVDATNRCFINDANPLDPTVEQHRVHHVGNIVSRDV
jgi:hypothetical protein